MRTRVRRRRRPGRPVQAHPPARRRRHQNSGAKGRAHSPPLHIITDCKRAASSFDFVLSLPRQGERPRGRVVHPRAATDPVRGLPDPSPRWVEGEQGEGRGRGDVRHRVRVIRRSDDEGRDGADNDACSSQRDCFEFYRQLSRPSSFSSLFLCFCFDLSAQRITACW